MTTRTMAATAVDAFRGDLPVRYHGYPDSFHAPFAAAVRRASSPGQRVLDVGSGPGYLLASMAEAVGPGGEVQGVDASPAMVAMARSRCAGASQVRVAVADAASLPFPDGHFDAVLLMSYLEHEHRPTATMLKVKALLRPGGCVFVKVPHYGCWLRPLLGRSWSGYFFPQHLYYFTPKTIGRLFAKCGLETVRNGFWDHVPLSDVLWATARRAG